MRIALLCMFVASAAAAQPYLKRGGYKLSGKYVYNYKMMMKVKMSEVEKQYTKLSMNATAELHFLPENNEVILKIKTIGLNETVRDANLNAKFSTASPFAEILKKYLTLPIKFGYIYGIVNKIYGKKNDPDWSVNIKKSIVNLFHVDIQGKDEETQSNILFTKPEISVFGICNTTYRMADYAVRLGNGQRSKVGMNITKIIDTDNCTLETSEAMNTILQDPIGRKEKNPMDTTAVIEYNIIGNEFKFKIESVNASGLYAFYPFSRKHGSVLAVTYQRLTLVEESGSIVKMNNPDWLENLTDKGKLTIKISPFESPDFLWQWKRQDWDRLVDFIHNNIMVFVQNYSPDWEPTFTMKNLTSNETETVLMLVNSLRLCKEKHLEKIWTKCTLKSRKWLLYLMAMCHTDECVKFMLKKIEKTNMAPEMIEEYLVSESFTGKTSKKQVELFFNLCKIDKIKNNTQLKTVCYVATSNLVRTLCKTTPVCATAFHDEILDLLKKLVTCKAEECSSIEKIPPTILLSVAENILDMPNLKPEFFQVLQSVILREDIPMEIRIKALHACRPLVKLTPIRVRIMLLKLFQDPKPCTEIRMTAFAVIMENPTQAMIEICARHLFKETRINLKTYVLEYIKAIATEKPLRKYERKIIYACQLALKFFWKPIVPKTYLSIIPRHLEMKTFSKPQKIGTYMTLDSLVTNSSFIPRYVRNQMNVTILGRSIPLYDAEMRLEGVQEYINRIIGADGILSGKKSVFDLIRKPRSIFDDVEEMLEEPTTPSPKPDKELRLFTQVRVFDRLFFINYTSLATNIDLKNLFIKGAIFRAAELEMELKKGKVFNWFKPIVSLDVLYKLPTLLGVPLICNWTAIVLPRLQTTIKAEVKPSLFSVASLMSRKRNYATLAVKENISVVTQVFGGIYFGLPVYEVGLASKFIMNMSTAINGKATMNFKTMKNTLELDMPQGKEDFYTLKKEFYHFIKPFPTDESNKAANITIVQVEPEQIGDLMIVNGTRPCNGSMYEEWKLKTLVNKQGISVHDNKLLSNNKETVFRVIFHSDSRKYVTLLVPNVGHVTTSRKSNILHVNPDLKKNGKIFEVEYKNQTVVILKTWAIFEKKFVPKEWEVLPREMKERQRDEYELKRLFWSAYKEDLLEDNELPFEKEHLQIAYVYVKGDKLSLTPNKDEAIAFSLTRNLSYYERIRQVAKNNTACYGGFFNMQICMHGYFAASPVPKCFFSPVETKFFIVPKKNSPEKILIKTEIQKVDKRRSIPVEMQWRTRIIAVKGKESKTRITIQTKFDINPHTKLRVTVTPDKKRLFLFEKMCFEHDMRPDNYSVWISMEENCKVRHLEADVVEIPPLMNYRLRKSLTFRLNYTTEKLPYLWQSIINTTIKTVKPMLRVCSDQVYRYNNRSWDTALNGSALVNFRLTSNKTVKITVETPRKSYVHKRELPVYIDTFPIGSPKIPLMLKLSYMMQPYCQHMNTTFKTIDDKLYNYKLRGECEHVLLRNCSANMTYFMVLVRKAPDNKLIRSLRIIVKDTEIDVTPEMDWKKKPYIAIDGEELKFKEPYKKYDSMKRPIYAIVWEPRLQNFVFAHFEIGLTVVLQQSWKVRTMISPLYFNKVCGLCGNFDGEQMDEFSTPEHYLVEDERLFGSSWILPGEACGDMCAKERYHVETPAKQRRHCKSTIPIAQCLDGCRPKETEKVLVPAICVSDTEDDRILLEDKLVHGKNVELKNEYTTYEEIEVPIECSCACENERKWEDE